MIASWPQPRPADTVGSYVVWARVTLRNGDVVAPTAETAASAIVAWEMFGTTLALEVGSYVVVAD